MQTNLFISHAWSRSEHYEKVESWLEDSSLDYKNYSVPKKNPLHSGNNKKLREDLTNQIKYANCVIVLLGMYAYYSDWINYEIDEAERLGKHIIGLRPWGQQRVPASIYARLDQEVGWNQESLISAIKTYNAKEAYIKAVRRHL